MKDKLDENGMLTNVAARNWQATKDYYNRKSTVVHTGDWEFLTPSSWTNGTSGYNPGIGRVSCIAFHPTDANTIYIGTPIGGIWKTTDMGATWAPLHDGMPSLGVSSIVVHPTNPNIIYILTGDGDGGSSNGIGVLKSTNGGVTWSSTGLMWDIDDFEKGYKLAMDPNNVNTLIAATTDAIWRTTNGGTSWAQYSSGTYRDIEYKPGSSTTLYAEKAGEFYRSTNSGVTWTKITSGTPTGASRLAIGVTLKM